MSKWILPVILICIFIIFNKSIDPIIASLLKENDLALLHDQVDEFLFERIKKVNLFYFYSSFGDIWIIQFLIFSLYFSYLSFS